MRYAVTSQQFDHLRKEGVLEFEGIYSEEQIASIKNLIEKTVSETGRDLQIENPPLFQALHPSMLGQIATQLYRKSRIKIAFTQRLPAFEEAATLAEISSVSEVFGGTLIDLTTGDASFYLPDTLIDLPNQIEKLLIAFTTGNGRYIIQKRDPLNHSLKKLGYAAGDRLNDQTHPLIHKT